MRGSEIDSLLVERQSALSQVIYPTVLDFRRAFDDAIRELAFPSQTPRPKAIVVFEPPPGNPLRPGPHHDLKPLLAEALKTGSGLLGMPLAHNGTVEWTRAVAESLRCRLEPRSGPSGRPTTSQPRESHQGRRVFPHGAASRPSGAPEWWPDRHRCCGGASATAIQVHQATRSLRCASRRTPRFRTAYTSWAGRSSRARSPKRSVRLRTPVRRAKSDQDVRRLPSRTCNLAGDSMRCTFAHQLRLSTKTNRRALLRQTNATGGAFGQRQQGSVERVQRDAPRVRGRSRSQARTSSIRSWKASMANDVAGTCANTRSLTLPSHFGLGN